MKEKIIGIGILAAVLVAVAALAFTLFGGSDSKTEKKPVATQYTADEASDVFRTFAAGLIGEKGTVLGAGCVPAKMTAQGLAQAETGPVYGCVVAVALPGTTAVAECDQVVIRLVKPSTKPEVIDAAAIDPSVCTG